MAIAGKDHLLLEHDSYIASLRRSLGNLYGVIGLTTELLNRLHNLPGSNIQPTHHDAMNDVVGDDFKCEKFMANLEYLLRYLRQVALDAITCYYLNIVEAHVLHWDHHGQHQKRIDEGWFAEWPNGQRPLSTTWPWNVKISLLVLWGVCWMFYGSSGYSTRTTRNRTGNGPYNEDIRRGRPAQPQLSQQQPSSAAYEYSADSHQDATPNTSEPWAGPVSNYFPNFSWLHPQQAASHARRANNPGRESYAKSRDFHD